MYSAWVQKGKNTELLFAMQYNVVILFSMDSKQQGTFDIEVSIVL